MADAKRKRAAERRVRQLILHAAQRQPFGIRTEIEDREQAPVDGLPDGQMFVFDDGVDEVVVIEITARAVPPEEGQRLKIGQRMVEAMAAGCAVEIELRAATGKSLADGEHAVGVVLFHGDADGRLVLRLWHGVEIADDKIRLDPELLAE